MVRADAALGVAEVDGVVRDPDVFAEGRGDGFLAVVYELAEDIVFLFRGAVAISMPHLIAVESWDRRLAHLQISRQRVNNLLRAQIMINEDVPPMHQIIKGLL